MPERTDNGPDVSDQTCSFNYIYYNQQGAWMCENTLTCTQRLVQNLHKKMWGVFDS